MRKEMYQEYNILKVSKTDQKKRKLRRSNLGKSIGCFLSCMLTTTFRPEFAKYDLSNPRVPKALECSQSRASSFDLNLICVVLINRISELSSAFLIALQTLSALVSRHP
jgi:hypothetical protein